MIEKTFIALKDTYLNTLCDKSILKKDRIYTMKFKDLLQYNEFKRFGVYDDAVKPVTLDKDRIIPEEIPVVESKALECETCAINLIFTGTLVENSVEYKVYTCPLCKEEVREPIKTLPITPVVTEPVNKPQYICGICGKIYTQEKRYLNHKCNNADNTNS